MAEMFRLVFRGRIQSGQDKEYVRQKLLQLYNQNSTQVERLLSGSVVVIKKNIDHATALKYKATFEKTGALCSIMPEPGEKAAAASLQGNQQTGTRADGDAGLKPVKEAVQPLLSSAEAGNKHSGKYDFILDDVIKEAWDRIAGAKGAVLGGVFLFWFISVVLSIGIDLVLLLFGSVNEHLVLAMASKLTLSIAMYPLLAGMIMIGVNRALDRPVRATMVFAYFEFMVNLIMAGFLVTVLTYLGLIALVIPGIYLTIAYSFVMPLIVDQGMGPWEAMETSRKAVTKHWFKVFFLYLVLGIIIVFSLIPLGLGLIWTLPLGIVANGVLYRIIFIDSTPRKEAVVAGAAADLQNEPSSAAPTLEQLKPSSKLGNTMTLVVVLLLALFLASIALRFGTYYMAEKIKGPDHVSVAGESIGVHADNSLFILDREGNIIKQVDLDDLGIDGNVADLELLQDGSILIGSQEKGLIYRCDVSNLTCVEIGPPKDFAIQENFKFAVYEPNNTIYISDTNNNSLLTMDLAGGECQEVTAGDILSYPNDIAFDRNGLIYVADTQNHRIMTFERDKGWVSVKGDPITFKKTGFPEKLKNPPQNIKDMRQALESIAAEAAATIQYTWPLSMKLGSDGNWWVVVSDGVINKSQLQVFSPSGERLQTVTLPAESIPVDIDSLGNDLLVADVNGMALLAVNNNTGQVLEFGSENFIKALDEIGSRKNLYRKLRSWSLYLVVILGVALCLLALKLSRQQRSP